MFAFRPQFSLYLLLLIAGSVVFLMYPVDIWVSNWFYVEFNFLSLGEFEPKKDWLGTEVGFWLWLYRFGPVPMALLMVAALVVFFQSLKYKPLSVKFWHAASWVLCVLLGPLLIGNIAKGIWNRPRPYRILEFDGDLTYLPLLKIGTDLGVGFGESFPSGHASSVFVLTLAFYLLYPKHRRGAWLCWGLAMLWGVLVSLARISQGGHFLSDVFWSFGLMQILNLCIYFKWLNIPSRVQPQKNQTPRFGMLGAWLLDLLSFGSVGLLVFVGYRYF